MAAIKTAGSYHLSWLTQMFQLFSQEPIKVPTDYRMRVLETKKLLESDTSGLVNTVLDFAIRAAAVDYTIETNDKSLDKRLNTWLEDINIAMLGRLPTGVRSLAKEYFRERWKGSSHLVLMTKWETVDGWELPTRMWFLDGEDVVVEDGSTDGINRIGDEKYGLLVDPTAKKIKELPTKSDEAMFFVQKPYDAWSTTYPVPFLIRRGIFENLKFLDLLVKKGEHVVQKAIEYMMLIKKGSEKLAALNNSEFLYSPDELDQVNKNFSDFLNEKRIAPANRTPTYTTNFDTELEHLIPELERIIKQALFVPIERRLLAGLGLLDIVESTGSTRKEALLNPKPLKSEVQSGVNDFACMLSDVVREIMRRNKVTHRKKTASKHYVRASTITDFLSDDVKQMIRSAYDRGLVSKETACELIAEMDFEVEVERRENEAKAGLDSKDHPYTMYPPVIQNQEGVGENPTPTAAPDGVAPGTKQDKKVAPDKQGPEKKNFTQSAWDDNEDLPSEVRVLPGEARDVFLKAANIALAEGNDEDSAKSAGWSAVKAAGWRKKQRKWVMKGSDDEE